MQYILQSSLEWRDWQTASARRLHISMFLATLMVAAILSVLRFPSIDLLSPLMEIVVDIVTVDPAEPRVAPLPQAVSEPVPQAAESDLAPERVEKSSSPTSESLEDPRVTAAAVAQQSVDWEAEKENAVKDAVDKLEKTVSVNPNFDERRRVAAIKFRPSEAPVKREIWDNVEKDQLGRTLLWSGNCYRVLDDPRVTNRWAFENFGQYSLTCLAGSTVGKELPWVEEIRDRHAYLRKQEDRRNGIFEWD